MQPCVVFTLFSSLLSLFDKIRITRLFIHKAAEITDPCQPLSCNQSHASVTSIDGTTQPQKNIELYSLIGTWLGTLFTFVGLLAVTTQLRPLLRDAADDRKVRAQNALSYGTVLGVVGGQTGLLLSFLPSF